MNDPFDRGCVLNDETAGLSAADVPICAAMPERFPVPVPEPLGVPAVSAE